MYSFLSSVETLTIKSQVREQIISLLGNRGKTFFSEDTYIYAEVQFSWYQKISKRALDIWRTPYKRILTYIALLMVSIMIAPPASSYAATETTTKFIVTAYYSPLPGQSFYLKGNLDAEKKLNGNGTHGASGLAVFTGMIAAPKSYDFGTQIFFDGLGVGTVSDRGGAIVEAWERGQAYDRIDIWMGYGEAGLRRALAWGRREVTATILGKDTNTNMNPIDISGIDNGRINLSLYPTVRSSGANGGISSDVLSAFSDLGYNVENNNVQKMILEFQLDHKIIQSPNDEGAGNYGPKTKAELKKAHDALVNIRNSELESIEKARQEMLDERTAWETRYKKAENSVSALSGIKLGQTDSNILLLQSVLSDEGFFSGKKDGKMKTTTILAIRKYQRANGLKQTGKIDKATKEILITDLLEA